MTTSPQAAVDGLTLEPARIRSRRRKLTRTVFLCVLYLMLIAGAAAFIFPFVWSILSSLKGRSEIEQFPPSILPYAPHFENYVVIWTRQPFHRFFINSAVVSVVCTAVAVFTSALAGYAFAHLSFPGKRAAFVGIIATLMVPFQAIMIPLYLLVNELGLVNTHLGIMLPTLVSAWGIFLVRQYMLSVHPDYLSAARIDGASEFMIFRNVVVPQSMPVLSVLTLFHFIFTWNNFLWPLLVINREEMNTIPLAISHWRLHGGTTYTVVTDFSRLGGSIAMSLVALIPILIVFFLCEKHITSGFQLSGLKGV